MCCDSNLQKMINGGRKVNLVNQCRLIMIGLPKGLGKAAKTQAIINRMESIAHDPEEFQYMTNVITTMVIRTKGAEVEVYCKGRLLDRVQLSSHLEKYGLEFNNEIYPNKK